MDKDTWHAALMSIREIEARRGLTEADRAFWVGFLFALKPSQAVGIRDFDEALDELGITPEERDYYLNDLYAGDSLLEEPA